MTLLEKLPKSPITGIGNVKIVDTFLAEDIIRHYKEQEDLNVEKYFRHSEEVYLLECEDTKYRFYFPFEVIGDADFYENLRNSEYDRDEADDHKFAYKHIKQKAELLEIGCGTGKFLSQISGITKNVSGLELNSLAAKAAIEKGFNVKNQLIEKHAEDRSNYYDVVCAFQVLEHIAEVKPFLEAALHLLKPGGKLIFSVPNNEPYFQRFGKFEVLNLPPHHMGLWSLESFQNLCRFFDIELAEYKLTASSKLLIDVYLRAKLMANVKSLPRHHSSKEKLKIFAVAPVALAKSSWDYSQGKKNNAHISVVFIKN